jgi:hypothetical protein
MLRSSAQKILRKTAAAAGENDPIIIAPHPGKK